MNEAGDESLDISKPNDSNEYKPESIPKHQRLSSSPSYRSRSRSRSSDSYHRQSRRHFRKRISESRSGSSLSSRSSSRSYSRSRSRSRSRSCSREGDSFPEKDPRDRSMRHRWTNNVWMIGEKVKNLTFHICDICDKPIVVYGRLKPCNHVFCLTCALMLQGKCSWCETPYTSCDRHLLGNIYQCTDDPKCRRTYLSQRDLQAHINHRHKKTSKAATAPTKSAPLQPPAKLPPAIPSQTNFSAPLPANFNVPPPLILSNAANTPPPNALLVAPPSSQMGIGGAGGRGNNAGPTGPPASGGDLATIAALAAAIQANPAAVAAVAAAGGLNVSQLCPLPTGHLPVQQQTHSRPRIPSPHVPDNPSFWSGRNSQL
ncbi:hypothetical protein Aperf_G00000074487 [Anoplocephala perfoliata]